MCGRFTITSDLEEIQDTFRIDEVNYDYSKRYNVAPTQMIPCILQQSGEGRILIGLKWGLIPFWSKDPKIAYKTINARSEGIEKKPAYRHLLKQNRVLIVSNGFYEWRHEKEGKQPFRFQLNTKAPFAFAGLHDTWKDPKGNEIHSCTIITTTPNELVTDVHDRMPVILTGRAADEWINPNIQETNKVISFLKPYPADRMIKYPVSKDVGNVKNTSPSLIEEIPLNSK
ncbi:SOS response-associated peptidase [Paenibacillus glucanolyticus]|uniref:Abasic site processing protein n=1 Tax=Paenibacillus glucanolyticus TaxID=59843 RepID=A0A163GUW7_9BACL|nr:SOS response-associated peptidase [Paenibacillus glucanolyticus]KZS45167.1 hypothetical protein AWU65_04075 [Paenibacillus glucanolyticus]OMF63868.1 hypothetical protein BK142_32440 [Paenibacillus glucanolyticus]